MNREEIKKLTPNPDINEILVVWSENLKNLLAKNLLGLYLTGSLTYGDFVPERSDIDLFVVVKKPLSADEIESVKALHVKIEERFKKWAGRIECSYLRLDLLKNILPPKEPRPYLGEGTFYPQAHYGNEWIINQYFLYAYSIALFGPSFQSLVKPINIGDVQEANLKDLFQEWEPKINDPAWLNNSHHQSYLVLNLCRILSTAMRGVPASKKVSAAWVKKEYGPQWQYLIEAAENWHYGMEMNRKEEAVGFIRFVLEKVKEKNISSPGLEN